MTLDEYEDKLSEYYPAYRAYLQSMPYPRTPEEKKRFDNPLGLEAWVEQTYGIKKPST